MTNPVCILKFGGASVATPEKIAHVAKLISQIQKSNPQERLVVVVSAMGDTTDELIALAQKVSSHALNPEYRRELDMLLTTGERVSMALLSMSLRDLGVEAVSLTGSQSGIITNSSHGQALIQEIKPFRIEEHLKDNRIVIVAGFQGVSTQKEITTLGRGGSDTSAVALGIALKAKSIHFFKDVEGMYSSDPKTNPKAFSYPELHWQMALSMTSFGAQVLHPRAIELAWKHSLPLKVVSVYNTDKGTSIGNYPWKQNYPVASSLLKKQTLFIKKTSSSKDIKKISETIQEKGLSPTFLSMTPTHLSVAIPDESSSQLAHLSWDVVEKNKTILSYIKGDGLLSSLDLEQLLPQQAPLAMVRTKNLLQVVF